jgi:hypothetical protein
MYLDTCGNMIWSRIEAVSVGRPNYLEATYRGSMSSSPRGPQTLASFLVASAKLLEFVKGLRGQLEHALRGDVKVVARREYGEKVGRRDACIRDVCREKHSLPKRQICMNV